MRLFKGAKAKHTIFKNTAWQVFSSVGARGLKFLLIPFVARILGPVEFGLLNYTISLLAAAFIFSDLGMNFILKREFPKEPDNEQGLVSSLFFLKTGLNIIGIFIAFIFFIFFVEDPIVKQIFFIILGMYSFTNWASSFLSS